MMKKVRKDSSWKQIRGLITLVIVVLAAFLLTTQQELIDNTLALVTGLAAIVPFLRQFISNFSVAEKKLPNFFPVGWLKKK